MRRIHVVALLLALALGLLAAGCLNGEETTATADTVVGTLPAATTPTEDLPALELTGDAAAGEAVFASSGCGGCHVLSAAGAAGAVGPNLDESKPDNELVVTRVTLGKGAMQAFDEQLDPQQIADVAAYVTESTGG
jgi:mono/diheme cytochrome c family protein